MVELPGNEVAKDVKVKGSRSFVIANSGKVYSWPSTLSSGEVVAKPLEISLPPKIQVTALACGHNFTVLVSKSGLVFSYGSENYTGQLGHGDVYPRDKPTLVDTLKSEGAKVTSIACGFKHVICKTASGKAYSWGWGEKGQLGHGAFVSELTPKLVQISSLTTATTKPKVAQVEAGFRHSVILLENKKILWFGSNSSIVEQPSPIELNLAHKVLTLCSYVLIQFRFQT